MTKDQEKRGITSLGITSSGIASGTGLSLHERNCEYRPTRYPHCASQPEGRYLTINQGLTSRKVLGTGKALGCRVSAYSDRMYNVGVP